MRTTSTGYAVGSAKPAGGERQTSCPPRTGAGVISMRRSSIIWARPDRRLRWPSSMRWKMPAAGSANSQPPARPATRTSWTFPACARGLSGGFRIWCSMSRGRRTSMSGASCMGHGIFRPGCESRARADLNRVWADPVGVGMGPSTYDCGSGPGKACGQSRLCLRAFGSLGRQSRSKPNFFSSSLRSRALAWTVSTTSLG